MMSDDELWQEPKDHRHDSDQENIGRVLKEKIPSLVYKPQTNGQIAPDIPSLHLGSGISPAGEFDMPVADDGVVKTAEELQRREAATASEQADDDAAIFQDVGTTSETTVSVQQHDQIQHEQSLS